MKTQLFSLFLLLVSTGLQAQEREALLSELTDATCSCVTEAEPTVEQMEMAIGLCVFQAGGDKVDQIESVLGYSISDEADMTALGEELGMRLATSCPAFLSILMEAMEEGELDEFLEDPQPVPPAPPGSERWSDIEPGTDRVGNPDGEEWLDIDRPANEEEFGNGPSVAAEEEVFPPTEEGWSDIDRPTNEEEFGNGPSSGDEELFPPTEEEWMEIPDETFPPTEEGWQDIERPADEESFGNGPSEGPEEEIFPPTEEEWQDIDRPADEEYFGNGSTEDEEVPYFEDNSIIEEEPLFNRPEEFSPPTEEEWTDIDPPATEEDFGNGSSLEEEDYPDLEVEPEYFPPTEEEWMDVDRPSNEEDFGNGPSENIGGSGQAEREFITEPLPNTNTSGLVNASLSGQIRRINAGLVSEIILRTEDRQNHTLVLSGEVPGAELLQRRAEVTISYREVERFDARSGTNTIVKEIIRVE
ncbi:MAG: hypothetical protein AAF433_06835 [Bacteroidota bacterium]